MKVTYDAKAKTLTLVLDVSEDRQPSASGKTLSVASTHGNVATDVKVDGKTLVVGVNAYVKA